jgi:iron(III) transport system substrate-binding protein
MPKKRVSILTLLLALTAFCDSASAKTELWVYTSIYKEFAAPLKAAFEKKHPDVEVQVYQGGSEKIQAKIEAEIIAQKPQADVVLVSDAFWCHQLFRRGFVYSRPGHSSVETNYYSMMVLISHQSVPKADRPAKFSDLTQARFKKKIQMGSPLESGTMFAAVAYLSKRYGWKYFEDLEENWVAANGGSATVIQKVETGEKKFGMVLLENALAAKKRGSPIDIIYPADGGIPIPSTQVIMKASGHKALAAQFADFALSKEGQKLLRNGFMYPSLKGVSAPPGAAPFDEVVRNSTMWTPERLQDVADHAKQIKKKFAELVLE